MICPKCQHDRSDKDDPSIPEYQCPACGVVYAKYKPTTVKAESSEKIIKNIFDAERIRKIKARAATESEDEKRKIDKGSWADRKKAILIKIPYAIIVFYISIYIIGFFGWLQGVLVMIIIYSAINYKRVAAALSEHQYKSPKKQNLPWLIGVLITFILLASVSTLKQRTVDTEREIRIARQTQAKAQIKQAQTPEQKIKKQFSAWDGSHRELVKMVKKNMNDPSSFDHESTVYWDNGDGTINVLMRYRGKNAFGGLVIDSVKAKFHIESGMFLGVVQ